jgi:O-antigen ligase
MRTEGTASRAHTGWAECQGLAGSGLVGVILIVLVILALTGRL